MVSGRNLIFAMFILGAGLLGGYELVRQAATPHRATLIEDRGQETGIFHRLYRFRGDLYRIREGEKDPRSIGSMVVSMERSDGSAGATITRQRKGTVEDVHFLELAKNGPPTIVVITRDAEIGGYAECTAFHLEGDSFQAAPLEPLPEELLSRAVGRDEYAQKGAFIYRMIHLEQKDGSDPPIERKLFYDFKNQQWKIAE